MKLRGLRLKELPHEGVSLLLSLLLFRAGVNSERVIFGYAENVLGCFADFQGGTSRCSRKAVGFGCSCRFYFCLFDQGFSAFLLVFLDVCFVFFLSEFVVDLAFFLSGLFPVFEFAFERVHGVFYLLRFFRLVCLQGFFPNLFTWRRVMSVTFKATPATIPVVASRLIAFTAASVVDMFLHTKVYMSMTTIKIYGLSTMTKQKRKPGRPIGGKHPEALRAYWRTIQQVHRESKRNLAKAKRKAYE